LVSTFRSAPLGVRFPRYQDLRADCEILAIGLPAVRLDGHLLLRQTAVGPVSRGIEAPDGAGVLCLYEPAGAVDAWGHRQQDGTVQVNVDGKASTTVGITWSW